MEPEDEHLHSTEVAKGTFWGLTGNFFIKIISFLYTIYIAHAVAQGDVGLFYLALGIIGIVGVWRDFGLPSALTRYVPFFESRGEHRKATTLLKNTYIVNIISSLALTGIIWFSADAVGQLYQNPLLPEALRLMAFYTLLENVFRINGSYIQGRADIKFGQMAGTAQVVAKLAFTFILFSLYGATLSSMTIAFLASYLFGIIISTPWVLGHANASSAGPELSGSEIYKEIVPLGMMLTVLQTFYTIISSTDRVILGYLAAPSVATELVAVYSFAATVGVNIMVFPGAVGGIFLPVISRLVGKNDLDGIRKQVGTSQRWILFITLPMAAVMIAFSWEMLTIFYGQNYAVGGIAMALFVFGLLFTVFTYTISLALAGMRLVKLELKVAAAAGIANVALNFLLIPYLGVEGAALAACISFALSGALFLYYGKRILGFTPPQSAYRLLAAGAITFALIYLSKPIVALAASSIPPFGSPDIGPYIAKSAYLALLGVVSVLAFFIFGALALFFKCFEKEDIAVAKKISARAGVPAKFLELGERIVLYGIPKEKEKK